MRLINGTVSREFLGLISTNFQYFQVISGITVHYKSFPVGCTFFTLSLVEKPTANIFLSKYQKVFSINPDIFENFFFSPYSTYYQFITGTTSLETSFIQNGLVQLLKQIHLIFLSIRTQVFTVY